MSSDFERTFNYTQAEWDAIERNFEANREWHVTDGRLGLTMEDFEHGF